MDENLTPNFDDDKIAKVRGNLFNRLIQAILNNRWSTGWGLISEKGAAGGLISLDPNVIPGPDPIPYWRGMIVRPDDASSEQTSDSVVHTIKEIDANDNIIDAADGGRVTDAGKAYNERAGVPYNTIVNVFEHPPTAAGDYADYKFLIPDGLTANPDTRQTKEDVGASADDWEVDDQGNYRGVEYDPARVALSVPAMWFYSRKTILDASGFVTEVGAEERDEGDSGDFSREFFIASDAADTPLDDHITLVTATAGNANGKNVKLNQPQADLRTLIFAKGTNVTLDETKDGVTTSDVSTSEVEVDDSGRLLIAKQGTDHTITINATGGTNNDGITDVSDGTTTVSQQNDGVINFDDTSNSGTTLGVNFVVTDDAGEADVTATVDASGLTPSDIGGVDVIDLEVKVTSAASTGVTTIDSGNFSGRKIWYSVTDKYNASDAVWADNSTSETVKGYYVGSAETVDHYLINNTNYELFIDVSDGYKLKYNLKIVPTSNFFHRISIQYYERKTSEDVLINT